MSFKANIDIALSFSHLKMSSLRQQGSLKFRVCLYHSPSTKEESQNGLIFCHPYSIMRQEKPINHLQMTPTKPSNKVQNKHKHSLAFYNQTTGRQNHSECGQKPSQTCLQGESNQNQSELDLETQFYNSRSFRLAHQKEVVPVLQTCCFRTYVDTQNFQNLQLKCIVELLFCSDLSLHENNVYKTIARCECQIRKMFDVSTYFPIVFDQFESATIEGIYQASLLDFRFEHGDEVEDHRDIKNFYDYMRCVTNSFRRSQTRQFYHFYRGILEKQLVRIQERHYDLLRVLKVLHHDDDFRRIKMNPNHNITLMIDQLDTSTTHNNYNRRVSNQSVTTNYSISNHKSELSKTYKNVKIPYYEEICDEILKDLISVKAHIFQKWIDFLHFTQNHLAPITEHYKHNYSVLVKERLSSNVFSHRINSTDWKISAYEEGAAEHLKLAELDRKNIQKDEELWKELFPVDNQAFFIKESQKIKIFQEIFQVNHEKYNNKNMMPKTPQQTTHSLFENKQYKVDIMKGKERKIPQNSMNQFMETLSSQNDQDHYVILVHGYQASRQDFILFKNCLEIKFKVKVFISTCNEGRTEDSIEVMGKRLAVELQNFLNRNQRSLNYKLSFIGHSMGGIIVRTALTQLESLKRHLYSFVSFSAPHLGYLYNPSTHIQAGLWFMNTWQKSISIEELCMRDKEEIRKCFLYKLSKSGTLNHFKQMALISSSQDKYVPYESARIEQNRSIISDKLSFSEGQILREMIDGVLSSVECQEFSRMDIIFNIQDNNFDSMIGRTGHVKFLSDRQFIKIFCTVFDKYFK